MSAIPRTTTESLHYGNHRWAIRVNGAGESHWSMSRGPENIHSDRRCNFCCSSVAPPVASLHGVASYDRRLDGADVGKLDCFRRSGRLELLRIKTPHAASLIAASCPCCAALKIGSKCLCWVINGRAGHGTSAAARHLITDTEARGRRGGDGPFADIAARTRDNFAVRRNKLKRNRKLIPIK